MSSSQTDAPSSAQYRAIPGLSAAPGSQDIQKYVVILRQTGFTIGYRSREVEVAWTLDRDAIRSA